MVWDELEYGWQMAFSKEWDAFCSGTIPVGAVIINETGELVSTGQNMIYVEKADSPAVFGSSLAHAEINAIVKLKRKEENPNQPVERITIVCMGHEPDLKASLEQELSEYKLDIEVVDILRDKADLQLKREAEADIAIEGCRLVIRAFYPLNLMQKLSLQKEVVEDWRQLVESVMIDWNYDGVVMQPAVTD